MEEMGGGPSVKAAKKGDNIIVNTKGDSLRKRYRQKQPRCCCQNHVKMKRPGYEKDQKFLNQLRKSDQNC